MKIAVCIFGQLRGDEETFDSINRHLIEPNSADVFIHTWNYRKDKSYDPTVRDERLVDFDLRICPTISRRCNTDMTKLEKLVSTMNPKKLLLEEQVVFDATSYVEIKPLGRLQSTSKISDTGLCTAEEIYHYQRTKSQFLTRLRAFNLIDDPNKYDVIFMLRNDLLMIEDLILGPIEKSIYAAGDYHRIFDQYKYGDPDSMRELCNSFYNLDSILQNHNKGLAVQFAEFHLATHLSLNNVRIVNTNLLRYFYNSGDGRYHVGIKY